MRIRVKKSGLYDIKDLSEDELRIINDIFRFYVQPRKLLEKQLNFCGNFDSQLYQLQKKELLDANQTD